MPTSGKQELSIYVHVPFCLKKCHYCSFYTIPYKEALLAPYTEAILLEGKQKLATLSNEYHIVSLFLGGGTPSLLQPAHIASIIETLAPQAKEITLEANPETLSASFVKEVQLAGVNRISIGVQTLSDPLLPVLGRTHDASSAIRAVDACIQGGITNISLDMLYGLPDQALDTFCQDVTTIASLPITHASIYNLTVDPHTVFYKYRKNIYSRIADEETLSAMSCKAKSILEAKGFIQYEIASYAKEGYSSIHNTGYWTDRPFLGLGVSASQYINHARSKNHSRLSRYMRAVFQKMPTEEFSEVLTPEERIKEALCLRLRMVCGARISDFPSKLFFLLEQAFPNSSFFIREKGFFKLSPRGLLFHDSIASEIMSLDF
ncbi:radical SAM family heme chaperone HemW [Chlamydiifrater phoenicopteri]|uniref:radical SAM family heme chaperone HemW n=1 Tax=Chlamydiifrater phoenicopteri TaxID=2681469 RepID=UPI001BCD9490|nr:radical SAM family heme chaperone HemW [Chlamydiifrater phoenicopteri]